MVKKLWQTVLILGSGHDDHCRFAEAVFNATARKMGLSWHAISKGFGPVGTDDVVNSLPTRTALTVLGIVNDPAMTHAAEQASADDFTVANRIVSMNRDVHSPLILEQFPTSAEKVEYWPIATATDPLPLIEREVMGLVARIVGGGVRQEVAIPEPVRPSAIEPVKKAIPVKVGRETAGRRGKGVTTVFDVPVNEDALQQLAATLKQRCGTGGTVKDGRIEIQGDQRERIIAELEKMGYKPKRVGG